MITLTKDELMPFLNKQVSIGVPNYNIEKRLFFYYGLLKDVSETDITILLKDGIKIISLEKIKDICLKE